MKYKSAAVFPIFLFSLSLFLSGCTAFKTALYSFRSTDHFIHHTSDTRVMLEPGAEEFADLVVSNLPEAVRKVEMGHYSKFMEDIIIFVCKSHESYKSLTGRRAKALMHRKKIYLSPAMMTEPETVPLYLTHELSHLMMMQKTGGYKYMKIPSWFHEGMATFVSDGGGAHKVSRQAALESIKKSRHFLPHDSAGVRDLFAPRYASHWKLNPHMFYRQAMIFVAYLKNSNEDSFKTFVTSIQNGKDFSDSFNTSFGMTTLEIWDKFIMEISS